MEQLDLVNADESPDSATVDTPGVFGASPQSVFSTSPITLRGRLPPRHLVDPLIDRFFKQVHSIFWVFPPDQFLRRLEKTYSFYDSDLYGEADRSYDGSDRREVEAPSWMCCLFTVLALGCSTTDESAHDILKPSDFFSSAKGLSRCVVEDESIQSIQALLLMVHNLYNGD
jgi:aldehyde dehydrogenase (NAD+)